MNRFEKTDKFLLCFWVIFDQGGPAFFPALDGLLVSVLTTWPNVRGFKSSRGRWISKSNKNPYHDIHRRETKPSVPCRKHLRYV